DMADRSKTMFAANRNGGSLREREHFQSALVGDAEQFLVVLRRCQAIAIRHRPSLRARSRRNGPSVLLNWFVPGLCESAGHERKNASRVRGSSSLLPGIALSQAQRVRTE